MWLPGSSLVVIVGTGLSMAGGLLFVCQEQILAVVTQTPSDSHV